MKKFSILLIVSTTFISGCAGLSFNHDPNEKGGLTYWNGAPYLLASVSADCKASLEYIMLPVEKRSVMFNRGYGTSDLKLKLDKGMVTEVNQNTDMKIPETLTSIGALAKVIAPSIQGGEQKAQQPSCGPTPRFRLIPISNGVPDALMAIDIGMASSEQANAGENGNVRIPGQPAIK